MAKEKEETPKSVFVKAKSAFTLGGGEYAKKGEIVEVDQVLAKDLLHRDKVDLASDDEVEEYTKS